ncbi:MAG: O-antigen ligase family protein [Anaerolineae bacterium]|nr:O-antigen ligase family protein [Anaerolineae bacterium]
MQRKTFVLIASSLLFLLSLLAVVALIAHQRARTRGIPAGLPEQVADSGVSPFCINAPLAQYEGDELEWALDLIAAGGFRWVRLTASWAEIEAVPGTYDWERWDRIVAAASRRRLGIIAVLDRAPAWAGAPPPTEPFARFAAAFVARYGDRIDHYQVWHNPNLGDGWGAAPDPAAYAELLRAAAAAIRAGDPEARILLGSLAPTSEAGPQNLSEDRFLAALYAAGAAPDFDILAIQPYGFDSGPDDRRVDAGVLNFSRAILIREAMVGQGDAGKAVWASHLGWNSLPAGVDEAASIWGQVDPDTQARYTRDAIARTRQEWPWMGVLCLAHFQPDAAARMHPSSTPNAEGHWGFAFVGPDGAPRPVYDAVSDLAQSTAGHNFPGAYSPLSGIAGWEGDWEFSALGADASEAGDEQVTIPFWGTDLGLRVRRGDYRGHLYVTVDGQPANALPQDPDDEEHRSYLVLTSPDRQPQVVTIPVAEGLSPGAHVAEIGVERGWDQWALAGWSVAYHPESTAYRWGVVGLLVLGTAALAVLVFTARRIEWRAAPAAWARLSEGSQLLITAATTALLWAAAWMTWATENGNAFRRLGDGVGITAALAAAGLFYYSPWFLLAVLAGIALFVLLVLRPDLAVALIAALAPFYTFPRPLLDKAFSMAEIVTLMAVASWGIHALANLRRRLRNGAPESEKRASFSSAILATLHPVDQAVLFLVTAACLSCFFAQFQRVAWRELRLVILEPALFYLLLRTSHLDRKSTWRVVDFFVLGGVAVALIGLVQYGLGFNVITAESGLPRLRSIYGSPNNAGLYLGRVLPLLAAIPLLARHRRRRMLYGLAALPVGAALLLTFSKGALLLGVPAALLTMGFLAGGRWIWVTLGAIVTAALAAIPLLRHPRFASLLDTRSGTTFFRLKLWQATLAMIRDHPWLGVGLDNFLYQYRGRYILPAAWEEPDLSHPHNILLDHWARMGIPGVVAGAWLQIAFWRIALPLRRLQDVDRRALAIGLMGSMVDLLAHGIVDHSFFLIDLAFAFFLIVGITMTLAAPPPPGQEGNEGLTGPPRSNS